MMTDHFQLDRLVSIMPPGPKREPLINWSDAEVALGVEFPPSYKAFLDTYGPGNIEPEFYVLDPRDLTQFRSTLRSNTEPIDYIPWEELSGPKPPHHAFPGPGPRLLTVGGNGNSDGLYLVARDGVVNDGEAIWLGNIRDDAWVPLEGPFCATILDLILPDRRPDLGSFNYWAWHLEPVWTSAR